MSVVRLPAVWLAAQVMRVIVWRTTTVAANLHPLEVWCCCSVVLWMIQHLHAVYWLVARASAVYFSSPLSSMR